MAAEYQECDLPVADYECFELDPAVIDPSRHRSLRIRGPRPESLEPGTFFACLGAAQTFGRFCARPFPTILGERLGLSVLNISHGGAGASFYCFDNERLLDYLNGARFVVLQVMSGRSEGNSLFETRGVGHYTRRSDGAEMSADEAFAGLIREQPPEMLARIVQETRDNWLASYRTLLAQISAPTVLFWFSTREPDYAQDPSSVDRLFGSYPQLVNRAMVRKIAALSDGFAQCTSRRGLPHTLTDRATGKPVTIRDPWTTSAWEKNWYYPSPEMHLDAARVLEPVCRRAAGLPAASRGRWPFGRRASA